MSEQVKATMPEYVSHKKVRALKIRAILVLDESAQAMDKAACLVFADPDLAPLTVDASYVSRIKQGDDPGYYVLYEDGYQSWSPTKAFEDGYTRVGS